MSVINTRLFNWRQIVIYPTVFVAGFVMFQRGLRYTCSNLVAFDCPDYWPVSIFSPRMPSLRDVVVAVAVAIAFFFLAKLLESRKYPIWMTIAAGALLIFGLTFVHGLDVGYYAPISGDAQTGVLIPRSTEGQEYYHDALTVTDPVDFLRRYNELQPTLHRHAHTHPPGAILTFYFLQRVVGDPALIGVVLMLIATIGTGYF